MAANPPRVVGAVAPKRLQIVGTRALGADTRALAVQCVEGGTLEGAGGKYVIVHTGVVVEDKAVKRAYSLVPVDEAGSHVFELMVKRLGGPGSLALHAAPVGAELTFSGPWGKLVPETGLPTRTLFVATDTGITSSLGLVEQHATEGSEVIWLREEGETFLDVDVVRTRVERAGARFHMAPIPGSSTAARTTTAFGRIDSRVRELEPALVIATGDGRIVHPLIELLRPTETRIECYFHNPEKKSVS